MWRVGKRTSERFRPVLTRGKRRLDSAWRTPVLLTGNGSTSRALLPCVPPVPFLLPCRLRRYFADSVLGNDVPLSSAVPCTCAEAGSGMLSMSQCLLFCHRAAPTPPALAQLRPCRGHVPHAHMVSCGADLQQSRLLVLPVQHRHALPRFALCVTSVQYMLSTWHLQLPAFRGARGRKRPTPLRLGLRLLRALSSFGYGITPSRPESSTPHDLVAQ